MMCPMCAKKQSFIILQPWYLYYLKVYNPAYAYEDPKKYSDIIVQVMSVFRTNEGVKYTIDVLAVEKVGEFLGFDSKGEPYETLTDLNAWHVIKSERLNKKDLPLYLGWGWKSKKFFGTIRG